MQVMGISNIQNGCKSGPRRRQLRQGNIKNEQLGRRRQLEERKRVSLSTADSRSSQAALPTSHHQSSEPNEQVPKRVVKYKKRESVSVQHQNLGQNSQKNQKCLVCQQLLVAQHKYSMGCQHYCCQTCIHSYVVSKVKSGNLVICLYSSCKSLLAPASGLFVSLPGEVQQQYKKILNQAQQIKISQQKGINFSSELPNKTTRQSSFEISKWQITQNQIYLLNGKEHQPHFSNLYTRYRTCKYCTRQIKKIPLCNRLNCQCGHNFCYLCQQQWQAQQHKCKYLKAQKNCEAQKNLQSRCNDQKCKKGTFKAVVLFFAWVLIIACILIPKFIIKSVFFIVICIITGITFYACVYAWSRNKLYKKLIALLFYPFTLFIGVGMAFMNFFVTHLMEQIYWLKKGNQFFLEC